MAHPAVFFENLVVDLMKAMDYGDGFVTRSSGDDGIDGIIHEDKLGFNLIYIQAKRWSAEKTVGKPEIQKFVGAMMGPPRIEKSLFITTARFSPGAKAYADAQHNHTCRRQTARRADDRVRLRRFDAKDL